MDRTLCQVVIGGLLLRSISYRWVLLSLWVGLTVVIDVAVGTFWLSVPTALMLTVAYWMGLSAFFSLVLLPGNLK